MQRAEADTAGRQERRRASTGADEGARGVPVFAQRAASASAGSITVKIGGVERQALIDTGSSATLVRADVLPSGVEVEPTPALMRTISGDLAPIEGQCVLTLCVGGWSVQYRVWVARMSEQCVLGLDFLKEYGCQINLGREGKDTVQFGGGEVMALSCGGRIVEERTGACARTEPGGASDGQAHSQPLGESAPRVERERDGNGDPPTVTMSGEANDTLARANAEWRARAREKNKLKKMRRKARRQLEKEREGEFDCLVAAFGGVSEDAGQQGRRRRSTEGDAHTLSGSGAGSRRGAVVDAVWEANRDGLDEDQSRRLKALLYDFENAFSTDAMDVGRTPLVEHDIDTEEARPIRCRPRRLPRARQMAADREMEEMLRAGVIEPSDSPWASAVVLVKKKSGDWRFCVDYRPLNRVTRKDSYPLPRVDETLDLASGSSWFSSLDLRSGYWQVPLSADARAKTAFSTGRGLFQFTVLPFGLCNAPATFARLMDRVLADIPREQCLAYLDDVLAHGDSFDSALQALRGVLERIVSAGLTLHPDKCRFMRRKVEFLGHQVGGDGVSTLAEKVRAVAEWPVPSDRSQVRGFLGLTSYYRRFVTAYSEMAEPLHRLLDKGQQFAWSEQCQLAFDALKRALCDAPVLAPVDFTKAFILDTDASNVGVGAVLSQVGANGERAVAYFSAALSKQERRYCVTRRELLALVAAIKHFRYYLTGALFKVRTDHAALQWLLSFREPEGQIARWLEYLQGFEFQVVHRAGEQHGNADALSRRPCAEEGCTYCDRQEAREERTLNRGEGDDELGGASGVACLALGAVGTEEWAREQEGDPDIQPVLQWVRQGERPRWEDVSALSVSAKALCSQVQSLRLERGVLQRGWRDPPTGESRWQVVVPQSLRTAVLESAHGVAGSGHFGKAKTLSRLRQSFYWGRMVRDVDDYCRRCDVCVAQKGPSGQSVAPLQQRCSGAPMERVAVDVVGPLPLSSRGNRYVLTAMDYFTKWPEAYAIPDQEAETVCDALLEGMFARFGVPEELHSDQGRNFESRVFAAMCDRLGIHKTRTTPLHPQSDGLVERFHRTMKDQLAIVVSEHQKDWDAHLPLVVMAYRSAVQTSTSCTPALLMLGRELRTPALMALGQPPDGVDAPVGPEYARMLQDRLEVAHRFARKEQEEAGARQRRQYDLSARGRHFVPGESVWVYNPRRKKGRCPKLDSHWEGPCKVLERVGAVVYRVEMRKRRKKVVLHRDRLAPYRGGAAGDAAPTGGEYSGRTDPQHTGPDQGTQLDQPRPTVTEGDVTGAAPRPQRLRRPPATLADFEVGGVQVLVK